MSTIPKSISDLDDPYAVSSDQLLIPTGSVISTTSGIAELDFNENHLDNVTGMVAGLTTDQKCCIWKSFIRFICTGMSNNYPKTICTYLANLLIVKKHGSYQSLTHGYFMNAPGLSVVIKNEEEIDNWIGKATTTAVSQHLANVSSGQGSGKLVEDYTDISMFGSVSFTSDEKRDLILRYWNAAQDFFSNDSNENKLKLISILNSAVLLNLVLLRTRGQDPSSVTTYINDKFLATASAILEPENDEDLFLIKPSEETIKKYTSLMKSTSNTKTIMMTYLYLFRQNLGTVYGKWVTADEEKAFRETNMVDEPEQLQSLFKAGFGTHLMFTGMFPLALILHIITKLSLPPTEVLNRLCTYPNEALFRRISGVIAVNQMKTTRENGSITQNWNGSFWYSYSRCINAGYFLFLTSQNQPLIGFLALVHSKVFNDDGVLQANALKTYNPGPKVIEAAEKVAEALSPNNKAPVFKKIFVKTLEEKKKEETK